MAATSGSKGSGVVPPRPGAGGARNVPKRPTGRPSNYPARTGRPTQRASARQAVQQRRQRNIYMALGSVGLVVLVLAVFITAKLAGGGKVGGGKSTGVGDTLAISPTAEAEVTGVSVADLISNAKAQAKVVISDPSADQAAPPQIIKGTSLTKDGKPEVLYVGAEYCPFCAAERWAIVMALSKFGTFTALRTTASASDDTNANTPTFSFRVASYKSKYLSFVPVELEDNHDNALENPTAAQNDLLNKWDVSPYTTRNGSIPFLYMDGKYLITGAGYDASKIAGWTFNDAASYMSSDTNATSQNAMATAGFMVGDLCTLTKDQPANVCSAVPAQLKGFTGKASSKGSSSTGGTTTTVAKSTTTAKSAKAK